MSNEHGMDTSTDIISDTEEIQPEHPNAPSSSSDEDIPLSTIGFFETIDNFLPDFGCKFR